MDELKEIVGVISRHKIKQIEVLGNSSTSDSLFHRMYDILQLPDVQSDSDVLEKLQPESKYSNATFAKLKNRFRSRLINTLFFIDVNKTQFTDIQKAFYTCNKMWLAARTLISRGARRSGINIIKRTIREANKYEFTELVIYMAKELVWHYSIIEGNKKLYDNYNFILTEALRNLEAETMAERYHTEIMLAFSKSQASKKEELQDRLASYSDSLIDMYPDVASFRFIRIAYLLHATRYQVTGEFHKAIEVCENALDLYANKPYQSPGALFTFNLRLLVCLIQTRDFDKGSSIAANLMNSRGSGSRDWYVAGLYSFLLCTHAGRYERACKILDDSVGHSGFKTLNQELKQLWLVNQAYAEFLRSAGFVENQSSNKEFRLYRFLNDMPIYSKDKRGINVSILIVHVLFLLNQRKYSEIIDRVDALNQYCHRYLRKDDTFRSNCFIKMLLQMARADFNRIRTERYAAQYYDRLHEVPLDVADQGIEVEVIPYEKLWELVLQLLD